MIVEFIKNAPWPVFLAVWVLFGVIWADVLLYFRNRYMPDLKWDNSIKIMLIILWPASVIIFIVSFILGILNHFIR